ncbi:MAG: TetR/AcrR family transcriptional regulator [Deltaproteobacteria bacterium]|nr:TetR/AcrR family transcriptional regulator [Deltaproteobacteria bacterium]
MKRSERTSRPPRAAGKRPELLELAKKVFSESGYNAASLREIGARAGMSAAALYYHFESKQDLLRAIVVDALDRAIAVLMAELSRGGEPLDRLRNLVRAHIVFTCENSMETKIIYEDAHFLNRLDFALVREKQISILNIYRSYIAELSSLGIACVADATASAFNLLSVINGVHAWLRPNRRLTHGQAIDQTIQFIVGGLCHATRAAPEGE